ncbi:MAG: hypothetical protein II688_03810 [Lachnospiraceae bacterium]|jgi:flagellar basal body-associated protein FliL|nr:hypothetical protein [Lachnospiraceae bacterium]MBQ3967792.1 hypothetical protein [Lachnospiraceae bacterium]MBR4587104.1 hypothetical protein [Lachnospiraceae bacterium]MCR4926987.1 hypothetical protein [Lachnospiraceae bacterium]
MKKNSKLKVILIIIGALTVIAAAAFAVYKFLTPDYLDDFDEDMDEDFDDDFFDDEEEVKEAEEPSEEKTED